MNNTRKGWWQRGFTFLKRTIIPMEVLRTLVRDITILTVFFTILQSEFDLLSREKEERQRIELFNALGSDSNLRLQPKTIEAFNNYLKPSEWINGDVYNTFKRQLPANSINIAINNASEGLQTQGAASEDPTQILVSTPTRGGRTRRQRSRRPRTQRKKQSKRRSYKYK